MPAGCRKLCGHEECDEETRGRTTLRIGVSGQRVFASLGFRGLGFRVEGVRFCLELDGFGFGDFASKLNGPSN